MLNNAASEAVKKCFAETIACFPTFDLRVVGSLQNAILVQRSCWPEGAVFTVWDNGGELSCRRVNASECSRSFPYETDRVLDGATVAYRVWCVINDKPIDYERSYAQDFPAVA